MNICLQEDDFVWEKLRWVIELSNGQTVFQDDGRPGLDPPSAWLRLAKHMEQHELHIVKMKVQFRSHIISLPNNAEGYFFCKAVAGLMTTDITLNFYIVGVQVGDRVYTTKYRVPELIVTEQGSREVGKAGECLLRGKRN